MYAAKWHAHRKRWYSDVKKKGIMNSFAHSEFQMNLSMNFVSIGGHWKTPSYRITLEYDKYDTSNI